MYRRARNLKYKVQSRECDKEYRGKEENPINCRERKAGNHIRGLSGKSD
jgi:hypothetical protein